MEFIESNWPWYVTGPLIGITLTMLVFLGKRFGITSNLETICSISGAGKVSYYFNKDWKTKSWGLFFIAGISIGGFIAGYFLNANQNIEISKVTIERLSQLGINDIAETSHPASLFNLEQLTTLQGLIFFVLGGFFIGFGSRYAGGCTSGHAISGMSALQLPSLIAVVGFFVGGLIMTHLLLPIILNI